MKQEKAIMRRGSNNICKGVSNSTRSKLKQTPLITTIKNVPLTAKVNTTWNNVLNKNKVRLHSNYSVHKVLVYVICFKDTSLGTTITSTNKCENTIQVNDPVRTLRFQINELKTKIDVLLPGITF